MIREDHLRVVAALTCMKYWVISRSNEGAYWEMEDKAFASKSKSGTVQVFFLAPVHQCKETLWFSGIAKGFAGHKP